MSGRYFLDTNILIYRFDSRDPRKQMIAADLIREGLRLGTGAISYQVIQEFYNTMLRRFPAAFSLLDSEDYLRTVLRPLLTVSSSMELYSEALRLRARLQFSWYDSLIVAAALEANCDVLYTEDLQHGQQIGAMRVVNPFLQS